MAEAPIAEIRSAPAAEAGWPGGRRYANYVLAILFLIYVSNFADRQIVAILAEEIKRDLVLKDWEIGMITGPAIALFYAVLGLPMAYVADRIHRVGFLAVCLVAWSGLTALGAAAMSGIQLGLTRMGVAVAEAGGTPISASIIGDYFPPDRRATALGIYSAATPVGVMVGFALGGVVNELVGWRGALLAAGVPGLLLALLLFTLREPIRGAADPTRAEPASRPSMSMWRTLARLWSIPEYRSTVLACAGANASVYVLLAWGPAVALRTFEVGTGTVGLALGISFALAGGISMVVSGMLCDRFNKRDRRLSVRIVGVVQLLSIPLLLVGLFASSFTMFAAALTLSYAATVFQSPVGWSVTQSYAPPEMRASAAASMVFVFTGVGLGLGPPLVGALSDLLASAYGAASLKYALLSIVATSGMCGLLLFFWTAPSIGPLPGTVEKA